MGWMGVGDIVGFAVEEMGWVGEVGVGGSWGYGHCFFWTDALPFPPFRLSLFFELPYSPILFFLPFYHIVLVNP